jgi:hypothetical protein
VLPAWLTAKAMQLCAAGVSAAVPAAPAYPVHVRTGAVLTRAPANEADAEATVRDLLALGADFDAGPLAINGRDFGTYGVTPSSVFDACTLAHVDDGTASSVASGTPSVSIVAALVRRMFAARITDTIRPVNAAYGARYSWHKVGQAIDFVPAAGVTSINRDEIRAAMAANGIRLLELHGPGDRGHSNHWHLAFARPGQVIDRIRPIEGEEDWILTAANDRGPASMGLGVDAPATPALASSPPAGEQASPAWDVFAAEAWRASHGNGS